MKPRLYTFKNGKKVPVKLRKVGEIDFKCPNCGRTFHRVLWRHIDPCDDEDLLHIAAYASCPCGAKLMAASDMYDFLVIWLNREEMERGMERVEHASPAHKAAKARMVVDK